MQDSSFKLKELKKIHPSILLVKLKDFLKEYSVIIVLIPTILGGVWQFIKLITIGVEYVRFFSASQVISDGIIILCVMMFYGLLLFVIYSINKIFINNAIKRKFYFGIILSLVLSITIIVYNFYTLVNQITFDSSLIISLESLPDNYDISLFILLFPSLYNILKIVGFYGETLEKNIVEEQPSVAKVTSKFILFLLSSMTALFGFMLTLVLMLYISSHLTINLGNLFLSNNLANTQNIKKNIEENYNIMFEDCKVLYFNDKYIFIEHKMKNNTDKTLIPNSSKEIIVLKFDDLFNE